MPSCQPFDIVTPWHEGTHAILHYRQGLGRRRRPSYEDTPCPWAQELVRAAGYYPNTGPDDTPAILEAKYEEKFLSLEPLHYDSQHIATEDDPWGFVLSNPVDLEMHCFQNRPVNDLTKMALARKLQLADGTDDALRAKRWQLPKDTLLAALAGIAAIPAVAHAPAGRGAPAGPARGPHKALLELVMAQESPNIDRAP